MSRKSLMFFLALKMEGDTMEINKFGGRVWKIGDSLVITIPSNIVRFGGINVNDEFTITLDKKKEEE